MPKSYTYIVNMTRTTIETAEIEVDAADDKDAERKAKAKAQAYSDRTIWSLDDEDIEITDVQGGPPGDPDDPDEEE